tara:strand:- start:225 stop:1016 length:792 start_codon:yes stop_codon:yes gene_type:complete
MEDSIEKKTILLDSYNAKFNADNSFYFDLQEDIKNCIYVKTLKTEIHIGEQGWKYEGENKYFPNKNSNGYNKGEIRKGDHIYVSLNDFERIIVPVKIKTPYTNLNELITDLNLSDLSDDEISDRFRYSDDTDLTDTNTTYVIYNKNDKDILNKSNRAINYPIKNITENFNKYYDAIYINDITPIITTVYKQELAGTSCGPNDTNTLVLNPVLPELRRFNVAIYKQDDDGRHVKVNCNKDNDNGIHRVILSFTIYYKRKKITRI